MDITKIVDRCRNWQDFRERLGPLTEKQKGDCFETLSKFYLKLHPEYLSNGTVLLKSGIAKFAVIISTF